MGGLTIQNKQFMLDGAFIREFGVNVPDLLIHWLTSPGSASPSDPCPFTASVDYTSLFQTLAAANIRFVRFFAFGHYTKTYRVGYAEAKATYRGKFDDLVAAAETYGIKLIPCLFAQQPMIPAYFAERLPDELGASSATWLEKLSVINDLVPRYKNSSALAMWEFGNEYEGRAARPIPSYPVNLDMESITLTTDDSYPLSFMNTMSARWKAAVAAQDATRAIGTGNQGYHYVLSLPETFAAFVADRLYNDGTGTIGIHTYEQSQFYSPAYEGYANFLFRIRQVLNVPFYIGEFGPNSTQSASGLNSSQLFQRVLDGIRSASVQLALAWNVPANLGTDATTSLRPDESRVTDWNALVAAQAAYRL